MRQRRYALWVVAAMGAGALLVGNKGFRKWIALWRQKQALEQELRRLKAEQASLQKELRQAREDPRYLEYRARRDLGMAKKGEFEYRFTPPRKKTSDF